MAVLVQLRYREQPLSIEGEAAELESDILTVKNQNRPVAFFFKEAVAGWWFAETTPSLDLSKLSFEELKVLRSQIAATEDEHTR